jgi:hypothetical protein
LDVLKYYGFMNIVGQIDKILRDGTTHKIACLTLYPISHVRVKEIAQNPFIAFYLVFIFYFFHSFCSLIFFLVPYWFV